MALRVLLVEDSLDDELLLKHALSGLGPGLECERVDEADALREALARARWDVVVCDYSMPNFGGLAALAIVRAHDPGLPFILVSATVGEEVAVAAMKAGASDYVMKGNLARLAPAVDREVHAAVERREREARIQYLAYYDPVTGLANRSLFCERLQQRMRSMQRGEGLAVAVIEVERLDAVGDALGRAAGDALRVQIGERLARELEDPSSLARVGGDRFALMLREPASRNAFANRGAELLRACFDTPFTAGEEPMRMSGRCGIAVHPHDGAVPELLLRNAQAAAAGAVASAEPVLFYDASMTTRVAHDLALEHRLRGALGNGEFRLHYQPKVSLADGALTGLEALIRWECPDLGMLAPGHFIPLLEQTGLIREVGAWVFAQAVADRRYWAAQGLAAPAVAVNVSAHQLKTPDFTACVGEAMGASGTPPAIELEITESAMMADFDGSVAKLALLRAKGLRISIDDFGTGHSSLAYLARLPVDALKIDQSFVAEMGRRSDSMTLVASIVALARALRLEVVAEGVETEAQAAALRALGCHQMQGFLVGRPASREAIIPFLRWHARARAPA